MAALSSLRIGGLNLDRFATTADRPNERDIATEVRDAGYAIISGKGYTSFGVAPAIVRICEAIVRDERSVVPSQRSCTGSSVFPTFI